MFFTPFRLPHNISPIAGFRITRIGRKGPEVANCCWGNILGHAAFAIDALTLGRTLEGATEADIHAIKKAMEKTPDARAAFLDSRTAISAVNVVSNCLTQIVIRPLKSPAFGSRERPE